MVIMMMVSAAATMMQDGSSNGRGRSGSGRYLQAPRIAIASPSSVVIVMGLGFRVVSPPRYHM
jgi:hypothetical protein